ncbi:malto-oligosyltrehalose synthase [Luteococcus sp. Sow4_B9]|uniref:malto-oligosyltrehalose synthase n=1 Tax=Luteococcus sp. Sow4_B9 TaxID=3438792 RepID=UPI003F96EA9C
MNPTSTYRLQITPEFRLQDAAGLVDYLDALGVGAVYLSPVLTSTTGSGHGYDVTDPTSIDPQRGGEEGWRELVTAARSKGLGIVVDIVPNHLGVAHAWENSAWWSVLAQGRDSTYAAWFDIDWTADKIVLPVLGSEDDLDALTLSEDLAELHFYEHRFPVAEGTALPGDSPRQVHDRQHYRLVPGSQGNDLLTHRRFFTVATLAGVRVEDPEVFDATHARILQMVREDGIEGLRVDHPDGLRDPRGYFARLRDMAPEQWIVAEKILEHGEPMPDWAVQGTSGYDAMTEVNQIFIDPAAEDFFTGDYQRRTGDELDVEQHVLAGKRWMAQEMFGAETRRILGLLDLGELSDEEVARALHELAARMEYYRSYLPENDSALTAALGHTRHDLPELGDALDLLEPQLLDGSNEAALRFQQLTGAVMAKGVEDTAWYRANRFVALNEVGGHPSSFGTDLNTFHRAMERREAELPESMTSLSTHDTKRGEDVRARLAALAEVPDAWTAFADVFDERTNIPEATFAHLLAQTLAGVGPVQRERLHAYAEKAMREASLATNWISPDQSFEQAVHQAIDTAYDDEVLFGAWRELQQTIAPLGHWNSLSQKLVQLTMPGIPDVYQGTEIWDDSLVDPDNRRPVHFDELRTLLDVDSPDPLDPAYKQKVVRTVLRLRRERPELFTGYRPITADGMAADHLVGFERNGLVTLATRLPHRLRSMAGWQDTTITLDGTWRDRLSNREVTGTVRLAELMTDGPVALLIAS